MKNTQVKTLQITAIVLQLIALLIVILMTIGQDVVKDIMISPPELKKYFVIPVGTVLRTIVLLVVYIIACVVIGTTKLVNTKVKTITMIAVACVCQIVLHNSDFLINFIVSRMGASLLATYSVVDTAAERVASFFMWPAFALFCVSFGGYYGSEMNLDK